MQETSEAARAYFWVVQLQPQLQPQLLLGRRPRQGLEHLDLQGDLQHLDLQLQRLHVLQPFQHLQYLLQCLQHLEDEAAEQDEGARADATDAAEGL